MRETNFIDQNKKKWQEFETMLHVKDKDPDKLSELFVQITDDLSYAKTFYPNRSVRFYLNNLAQQVFYNIYKGKKNGLKNFKQFWVHDLPKVVFESRKELTLAFIIFIISFSIGVFSNIQDPDFPKYILGNSYVEMTKENIKSGDPMAVYKSMNQFNMFLEISLNNILVAFRTFVFGVFFAVGTIVILLYNGVMVGTFQYFFIERGLFWESFLTIWLHGTLEISSIIIAGGAGLKLGSGLVFPGTYSRLQAFKLSAKKGLMIMMGITPIFVMAAIIESFVTRYTDVPAVLKASLIIASLFFIVGYFIFIPLFKARRGHFTKTDEEKLPASQEVKIDITVIKTNGEIFPGIFIIYKKYLTKLLPSVLIGSILYGITVAYMIDDSLPKFLNSKDWFFIRHLFYYDQPNGMFLAFINTIFISVNSIIAFRYISLETGSPKQSFLKYFFFNCLFALTISALIQLVIWTEPGLLFIFLPLALPILLMNYFIKIQENKGLGNSISRTFGLLSTGYGRMIGLFFILSICSFIYFFLIESPITYLYFELLNWNINLNEEERRFLYIIFSCMVSFIALQMILPMFYIGFSLSYFSIREMKEAVKLKERIMNFGAKAKNVYSK